MFILVEKERDRDRGQSEEEFATRSREEDCGDDVSCFDTGDTMDGIQSVNLWCLEVFW